MKILGGQKAVKKLGKRARELNVGDLLNFREVKLPGEKNSAFLKKNKKGVAIKLSKEEITEVLNNLNVNEKFGMYEFAQCKTIAVVKMEG